MHHKKWLRHSDRNSDEGERLQAFCGENGLRQCVQEPTRGNNLLDLVLTDMPELTTVKVLPALADHRMVLTTLKLPLLEHHSVPRKVWHYREADWDTLKTKLAAANWDALVRDDVDASTDRLTSFLQETFQSCVPYRTVEHFKSTHPWLNERCRTAIALKCASECGVDYEASRDHCSKVLVEEYKAYQERVRAELRKLPKGSKKWWRLNRQLLAKHSGSLPRMGSRKPSEV